MTELNPPYVMKRILVDKLSIKNFYLDDEGRRRIRNGKVKEILSELNEGTHFSSPVVVNEKTNDRYNLIDGNHRLEAIKLKLGVDKEFKIYIWSAVYRNLNKEEERVVYRLWNLGTVQSSTDFLKAYWKTLPCGDEILKELPVTIYGDNTHLGVKLLVGSYINAKRQRKFEGGYGAGKEKTVSDFCEITPEDISEIKEFTEFMREVFGTYNKNILFYKSTPLATFMRIWYDNKDNKKLKKIFIKEFASKVNLWEQNGKAGGREACNLFYNIAITHLKKRYGILSDEDLIPKRKTIKEIVEMVKKSSK